MGKADRGERHINGSQVEKRVACMFLYDQGMNGNVTTVCWLTSKAVPTFLLVLTLLRCKVR